MRWWPLRSGRHRTAPAVPADWPARTERLGGLVVPSPPARVVLGFADGSTWVLPADSEPGRALRAAADRLIAGREGTASGTGE
jgi:hypothetical protein